MERLCTLNMHGNLVDADASGAKAAQNILNHV